MAAEKTRAGAGRIDWGEQIRRQEAASAALLQKPTASAQDELAILEARAAALAVRADQETGRESTLDCLEFQLSGESYAVEMPFVSETLPLADFTPVFCTPPFVLGVTNVRGKIISIVDLRRFFGLPLIGLSDLNRVIVVGNGRMEFGVLADAIVGMRTLSLGDLQPPPATFTGIREEFLTGVTTERLALLDIAKILSDKRMVVHEEVTS
jgi:purine-binding chemotaxis protein CheW